MAIIGFILCTLFLLQMSAVSLLFFADGAGQFNIGGVPNSLKTKVLVTLFVLLVGFGWYMLFTHAPFSVTFK
jgi:cytochrome c biogenesis factor